MIMEMEEEVQRVVMMAIQELHGLPTHSINSLHPIEDDTQVFFCYLYLEIILAK